ncbi:MAG: type III polyketide synthase [Pseudomonadota bacterium]
MSAAAHIHSIATAVPEHRITQDEVVSRMSQRMPGGMPAKIEQVYAGAGIATRHIARPADAYMAPAHWPERNAIYLEEAEKLMARLAADALAEAEMTADMVDIIVCVSSTGIATPSIPTQMLKNHGFRDDIETVPLFGYGCAGGILGLQVARDLACARPDTIILLLCVELCSLAFRMGDFSKKGLVSTALFADGGSAMVISANGYGPRIGASVQKTWPDTRDMMGWDIDEAGLGLILARDIPSFVTREFAPIIDDFLDREGLERTGLRQPACHPGGRKVIEALERYFDHLDTGLCATRKVLNDYGNMSSPTVHFILKQLLESEPGEDRPLLMTALGPGFTGAIGLIHP